MFARLPAAVLLALPLLVAAQGCTTGTQQCCNSLEDAKSVNVANLLFNVLGASAGAVTGQVGVTCSPITALGIAGTSCNQQTVCCENNNFNGVVTLGCTPINASL